MQPAHILVGVGNQRNVAIRTQATFGTCLGIVPQSVGAIGRYGFLSHDGARRGVNQGALSQNHPSLSLSRARFVPNGRSIMWNCLKLNV